MVTREELESKIETIDHDLIAMKKAFQTLENEYNNYKIAYHIVEDELKIYKEMLKNYENF